MSDSTQKDAEYAVKKAGFLRKCESAEELRNWVFLYLGVYLPSGHIDADSNSSPVDAMWEIYDAVKNNRGEHTPGYIMLSSRDSYKTLSASILEVMILLHFQLSIAHMAAILAQSNKAVSYIQTFFTRLEPYIRDAGWVKTSDSKTKIQFSTPEGNSPYITVVICTLAGANSEHVPVMFIDEIDVIANPKAYEEAKMIPTTERGQHPITVKLSTRKFAFGLMSAELEAIDETGEKLERWNIMDITERCPPSRHKPSEDGSMIPRYVRKAKLPLGNISPEDHAKLTATEQENWERLDLHPGCLTCPLASVCGGKLAERPETDRGGLFKPISSTINAFKRLAKNPDMAAAQLMCLRPSTKGLVYPRYEDVEGSGNLVSVANAYEMVTGETMTPSGDPDGDFQILVDAIKRLGIPTFGGVDWGFTHASTIVVVAVLPSGHSLLLDNFAQTELETHDFLEIVKQWDLRYQCRSWFCDQANPSAIKTLKKAGLKCPDFTKDVMGGIDALRGQVVTTMGVRKFLIVNTRTNGYVRQGFKIHHFKLDAAGNPTTNPDDEDYADVMDALRYLAQNVYGKKQKSLVITSTYASELDENRPKTNEELMKNEVRSRVLEDQPKKNDDIETKKKKIFW
jgi:hypothetical protein